MTTVSNEPYYDDAREGVAIAFSSWRRPSSAATLAAWAAGGLAPVCSEQALARAAARVYFLEQAAEALSATAPADSMRWAWSAPAMAKGWAEGLGLGARLSEKTAEQSPTCEAAQDRSGVAREALRHSLFPLIGADEDELEGKVNTLASWFESLCKQSGGWAHVVAAQAMAGMREAFEEAALEQGATDGDLERAQSIARTLLANLSDSQRALAKPEYEAALGSPNHFFAQEFQP